jgi:LmbE family N-acetylglucosaminyl deacetylase
VVHVTDSAPRDARDSRACGFDTVDGYRSARQTEFRQALNRAGLRDLNHQCFEIADQEACLCLSELTWRMIQILADYRPEVVITHPYEGGHPDHDACAFGVHRAVTLGKTKNEPMPLVIEAAFYHTGPNGMETGSFLPADQPARECCFALSREERQQKQALLACFTTQRETLKYFGVDQECFRIAPSYDFQKPPHPPPVFYDGYPWGMESRRFCQLALRAEENLRERLQYRRR